MDEHGIDISAGDLDLGSFDKVIDISTATDASDAFADAHRMAYLNLTGDPASVMDTEDRVLVICDVGSRSHTAATILRSYGYRNVFLVERRRGRAHPVTGFPRTRWIVCGPRSSDTTVRSDSQDSGSTANEDSGAHLSPLLVPEGLGCPALSYLADRWRRDHPGDGSRRRRTVEPAASAAVLNRRCRAIEG